MTFRELKIRIGYLTEAELDVEVRYLDGNSGEHPRVLELKRCESPVDEHLKEGDPMLEIEQ